VDVDWLLVKVVVVVTCVLCDRLVLDDTATDCARVFVILIDHAAVVECVFDRDVA